MDCCHILLYNITGSWIVRLTVVFNKQENSKVHKRSIISIPNTIKFDRQVNSTGYKRSNRIKKKILESHVGSAWQTGRGRKADDNFFFD